MADGASLAFLSPEWLDALAAAVDDAPVPAVALPPGGVVVQHEVTSCPPDGRTVVYTVRAAPGAPTTVTLGRDDAERSGAATASFSASYDAALDVLLGRANAQQLLADGRLRFHGDLESLAALSDWFEALARAWAPVRERTRG